MKTDDYILEQLADSYQVRGQWTPAFPLLQTFQGTRYYLGCAVYTLADDRQVLRTIYKGKPSESYSEVLAAVRLALVGLPAPDFANLNEA
jgi:hypothetical protein